MAPQFDEFHVSHYAEWHMFEKHGVDLDEAMEAAESTDRHTRTYGTQEGEKRYVVPGKTESGRRLWVVFADEGNGVGRVITAYDPLNKGDMARHRQMRGD